jgi:GNAT superfamily N-acetyltransferase
MTYETYSYENDNISSVMSSDINNWSNGLWYDDLEEAGVCETILVWDGDDIVAYQTISGDRLCVAIEVKEEYQGKGLARLMVEESGCYEPERNENPEFWSWAEEIFG